MDKPKITWKMRIEIILAIVRIGILYALPFLIIAIYFGDGEYPSGKTLIIFTMYTIIVIYIEEKFGNSGKK